MTTIKVLDHGYVEYVDSMGTDKSVIEAARMSSGKGFLGWGELKECKRCMLVFKGDQFVSGYDCGSIRADDYSNRDPHDWQLKKGDESLLEYLYKNQHMTPFEMCELHIEVSAPIFVFREWHRHRTQSFNEFSARYAQMPNEHYVPHVDRFVQKLSLNKQESSVQTDFVHDTTWWRAEAKKEQAGLYKNYEDMIFDGVPREVARINTPVSRYSKMRAKTDLRNWLAFLKLRMAPDAQWEIRQYANAVAEIVKEMWPRTWALFEEYTLGAVTLSRSQVLEMKKLFKGELALPREAAGVDFPLSEGFLEKFK